MENMNRKLVSIVVPVFNRAEFLPKMLDSLKAQDYRPLQVVLVDNDSTDSSHSVCEEFLQKNKSKDFDVLVVKEIQPGAAAARNCGLSHCLADIVAFFDSDDEMSPDFVSVMHKALTSNVENDVAIGRTRLVFADGKERVRDCWPNATAAHQILAGVISTVSFLAYKSFLYDIGGWNPSVRTWDDYELGVRILMYAHQVEWVNKTFHRIHNHNVSITGESFSATVDGILGALECVDTDINHYEQETDTDKRNVTCMRSALFFRYMMLKGWLLHEGNQNAANKVEERASRISCTAFARVLGRTMCFLTAHGIRGAWRLGKLFL
ncbi:MAG: glycosyltransferase family 2 protein [Bacteroidaceae bacterium]|nr:glycosyltransferase family 2 protein [Bacteroidaceae bacterium]